MEVVKDCADPLLGDMELVFEREETGELADDVNRWIANSQGWFKLGLKLGLGGLAGLKLGLKLN